MKGCEMQRGNQFEYLVATLQPESGVHVTRREAGDKTTQL